MNDLSKLYTEEPVKACRLALRRTAHINWKERMEAINKLLGLHGVEAIRGDWQNGYWCDIVATYCNTGESYGITVIHVRPDRGWSDAGTFRVSSWGGFVERNSKKYGIQ